MDILKRKTIWNASQSRWKAIFWLTSTLPQKLGAIRIDPRSFAISFARAFSKMLRMRMHQGLAWRRLSMSMTMPRAIFQSGSCRISTIIMICLLRRCMFISTKAVAWR